MDDAVTAAALRWGVNAGAIRAALGLGDIRVVAQLLGVRPNDVEDRVAQLTAAGARRSQALGFMLLAV